jgi:dihydropyrimidinase
MAADLAIRDGQLVTENGVFDGGIAIDDGEIVAIGDDSALPAADETVDASGQLVMPGIVDPHVHIDDMFSIDTYETATGAAALGGVTTCIDFGWQAWTGDLSIWEEEGTLLEGIEEKQQKARDAYVDYGLHGAITREDPAVLDRIASAVDRGVTSFKMFTAYEHGLSNGFMHRVFDRVADAEGMAILHTEDGSVCDTLTAQLQVEERGDPESYPESRPDYAEAMAAENAVRMATEAGCKYYGLHTSCRKSADVLTRYQETHGEDLVRAETCTHYTTLDDSVYSELGNLPMIAPPIRTNDDIEVLFDQLGQGCLDVVSSDHNAYERASKQTENWWDSAFGANSLQTSFPVFHDEAVNERGYSYPFVVRAMSATPARLFGLPEKGSLQPGTDADIVLFDPSESYRIDAEDNASNADYSLHNGREVTGRVEKTFVRGELVAEDGEIVGDPGHGVFVERDRPDWSS